MVVNADDVELDVIESVLEAVGIALGRDPSWSCAEFVRQYLHWVPAQDLRDRDPTQLAGAVLSQWEQAGRRLPGEAKVRVRHPDGDGAGWGSPHSTVEIVCDDMPFLVDSVTMRLIRGGYAIELLIHPVLRVVRDHDGILAEVLAPDAVATASASTSSPRAISESVIHVELLRESDPERLTELAGDLREVLSEVRAAVEDWSAMRTRATELAAELGSGPSPCEPHLRAESEAFLGWLADDHFTFLGYREYELGEGGELRVMGDSGLGILRGAPARSTTVLSPRAIAEARSRRPLVLSKANARSTVHRPAYLDYVGVKRFAGGEVVGERRFLGLYTSTAYREPPAEVPLLRDLLFQIDTDALFEMAMGIVGLGERPRVRLFVSRDRLDRFVAVTLCMPRERFTTGNAGRVSSILAEAFGGDHVDWRLQRSESVVARVDSVICASMAATSALRMPPPQWIV
jgi:glutamate dehydrogenase